MSGILINLSGVLNAVLNVECCLDQDLFTHIANFIVKEHLCLSDHSPIVTWLNINTNFSSRDTSPESDTLTHLRLFMLFLAYDDT